VKVGNAILTGVDTGSNVMLGNSVGRNQLTGGNNVLIGNGISTTTATTANLNCLVGNGISVATAAATNSTGIGRGVIVANLAVAAGSNLTCEGAESTVVGRDSRSLVAATESIAVGKNVETRAAQAICVGTNSRADAANSATFGNDLINTVANTQLFGRDLATVSRFTGYVKTGRTLCCSCGFSDADPAVVTNGAAAFRIPIVATRFNFGMVVSTADDWIELGAIPDDRESTFIVTTNIRAQASSPLSVWRFNIFWQSFGTGPAGFPLTDAVIETTSTQFVTNTSMTTLINVPIDSIVPDKVWVEVIRTSAAAANLTIRNFRFAVTRVA
jgi:hypothetical protein